MKRSEFFKLSASISFMLVCAHAQSQQTQQQGFADGKAFKNQNSGIKNGINQGAMTIVPGQDPATLGQLQGLYGGNLIGPGSNKVSNCATYTPGANAYKNQECETVNFVSRNPGQRQTYALSKTEPLITSGIAISNTPRNYTSGVAGLNGNYSACTNKTTNLPEQFDTERCQIGREVREGSCPSYLVVTYTWEVFANQPGADLNYGRCDADIRGDLLTLPATNTFQETGANCADHGNGTGRQRMFYAVDCFGNASLHGFDASACSKPPTPAIVDPARVFLSCTNAPRTKENCFSAGGNFTKKATVPVFVDSLDESACQGFFNDSAVIK